MITISAMRWWWGVAMGFALIPIIFSLAEDALFSVPPSLSQGSLALGGNPLANIAPRGAAFSLRRYFLCGDDRFWPCGG